jgi:AcrR family transcriptional regulator
VTAGRPRRYSSADESQLLLDAALVVMQRNGSADAAVADIIAEAGVSTRSFYRHFSSKDQLLCALYRHELEQIAARLGARVGAAPTPLAALECWIEELMGLGYQPEKAAKVAVLGSPAAMRADGYAREVKHANKLLMAPLAQLLDTGHRDGTFPLADPVADAPLIQSVVWSAAGLHPHRKPEQCRADACQSVRSLCWRALGVSRPLADLAPRVVFATHRRHRRPKIGLGLKSIAGSWR